MRYILKFSYAGANYSGYQRQKNKKTIQEEIEKVFLQIFKTEVPIVASGRTDAGVSAIEQVAHFDVTELIDTKRICGYANSLLPDDIRINAIEKVEENFHARYSAKRKTYEYLFYVGQSRIPVYDNIASHINYNVDINLMQEACQFFMGEHDFSSFCASNTDVKDKKRTIYDMNISCISDNLYRLSITGSGFLYNMVRIIMGTLSEVGIGKIVPSDIKSIILSQDRAKSGKTAEAKGLYLKKVLY